MEMEAFRICPICLEVPEEEIYQCVAGHVMCNCCAFKLSQNRCPTCRVPLGEILIRCRALEGILDTQLFECKFIEKGCAYLGKREDITRHTNSCSKNPDLLRLCEQMGFKDCKFGLGRIVSNSRVKFHFTHVHKIKFESQPALSILVPGEDLRNLIVNRKRKSHISNHSPAPGTFWYLISEDDSETSPLFLIYGNMNFTKKSLSFICIQVWGHDINPTEKYNLRIVLRNNDVLTPPASPQANIPSTTNLLDELLPMRWTSRVCTINNACHFLREPPINISTPFLLNNDIGTKTSTGIQKQQMGIWVKRIP